MRVDPEEEALLNLQPIQTESIQKNIDRSWNTDMRLAHAEFYYLLGEYLGLENNLSSSQELFHIANELDPNEFLAMKDLQANLALGKDLEAKYFLQRAVLQYPQSPYFHLLYAEMLFKEGLTDKAISEFEKSIEIDPKEEKAYVQLFSIYKHKKSYLKARSVLKRLNKALPQSVSGNILEAHLFFEEGHQAQALHYAKKAYDLNPRNSDIALFYAKLLELRGKEDQAAAVYDDLFKENPSLEELLIKSVSLYRTFGDLNDIYKSLDRTSKKLQQPSIGIEIQKTIVLWELSRNDEALKTLLRMQEVYPGSEQIIYLTGLANERLADIPNALSSYRKVSEESSFFLPANFQIIRILDAEKKFEEASKLIHQLAASRFATSDVYVLGATLYSKENKFLEAIDFLKEGYSKHQDQLQLLFLIGVYQEKAQKINDCLKTMKQVVLKDPNFSPALNFLGYIWADLGIKLDLAQSLIERALSIKPNDGFYLDSLGWVYFKKKEYEKALEVLEKASKIEPEEGVILEHIGDVYSKLGKTKEAQEVYKEALKKNNLDEKDKIRIQEKLESKLTG